MLVTKHFSKCKNSWNVWNVSGSQAGKRRTLHSRLASRPNPESAPIPVGSSCFWFLVLCSLQWLRLLVVAVWVRCLLTKQLGVVGLKLLVAVVAVVVAPFHSWPCGLLTAPKSWSLCEKKLSHAMPRQLSGSVGPFVLREGESVPTHTHKTLGHPHTEGAN